MDASMTNSNSNITLVVTSCGRFDLLKKTLDSFVLHNTAPVKRLILTEDSGSDSVYEYIPSELRKTALVFINNPKIGQVKSIDLAYSHVDTDYIFHCEDDWLFLRPGFMEESLEILEKNPDILQVRLHNHQYKSNNLVQLEKRFSHLSTAYYSISGKWQSLSWNPGLRRIADYNEIDSYEFFYKKGSTFLDIEGALNSYYTEKNKKAVLLENYAVEHIGDERHIIMEGEIRKKKIKKIKKQAKLLTLFSLGILVGTIISRYA
jgi:hypothetical protein